MIQSYSFGSIKINDKIYRSDLVIYPEKIDDMWWREEGHNLCLADIEDILEYKPEVLIIVKGYFGILKVANDLLNEIEDWGIEVITLNTRDAAKKYNAICLTKKLVAALHLTC